MPRALERSPQSCEWPPTSGAISVSAGLLNDPAVDRNAALGWPWPTPSIRFYVKPESIPATSAFAGINLAKRLQCADSERLVTGDTRRLEIIQ
jgi:hypothetical protein